MERNVRTDFIPGSVRCRQARCLCGCYEPGTTYCREDDPANRGPQIAGQLKTRFRSQRYGIVGLHLAILEGLTKCFSPQAVRVIDLNPDNSGSWKYGVEIWDGSADLPRLAESLTFAWPQGRVSLTVP